MKKLMLQALLDLFAGVLSAQKETPNLGKVVDGYLVSVDEKGVILQGYDPVSIRNGSSQMGDAMFQTKYQGAIYYFASAENKAKFDANPTEYEPEYGGYCAYGLSVGHLAPIELWTYDKSYQNRNIFQHNQKAINGWKKDIPGNDALAKKEWVKFKEKFGATAESMPPASPSSGSLLPATGNAGQVAQTATLPLDGAQSVMRAAMAYASKRSRPEHAGARPRRRRRPPVAVRTDRRFVSGIGIRRHRKSPHRRVVQI